MVGVKNEGRRLKIDNWWKEIIENNGMHCKTVVFSDENSCKKTIARQSDK